MADLLLDSLEISNFKLFKHLKIERLGRVNLVVGQNGAGKTALLEALWLYANRGTLKTALEILKGRRELNLKSLKEGKIEDEAGLLASLKQLYYGRKEFNTTVARLKIGPAANPQKAITLEISKNLSLSKFNDLKEQLGLNSSQIPVEDALVFYYSVISKAFSAKGIFLEQGGKIDEAKGPAAGYFISDSGLTEASIIDLWGGSGSPTFEKDILEALKIIQPELDRVMVAYTLGDTDGQPIRVKLGGVDGELPLKSLGNGLSKVLGIALALVNSKDGILLVDEIENGLHFSTQLGLWRLIFKLATRLNVQVFATTHSWDCIEAFQKASLEDPEVGMLVRLDKTENEITPIVLDENRLKLLTRKQFEVR